LDVFEPIVQSSPPPPGVRCRSPARGLRFRDRLTFVSANFTVTCLGAQTR
jgi:hypothetical protein